MSTTPRDLRIGIDLGGTKIEIIAIDSHGAVHARQRVATPRDDYAAIIEAIVALIEETEAALGCRATIGIGTPGSLSRADRRLRNSNSTCLNGQRIDADLEARLNRPVRSANDANCFALSEAVDGAARGAQVVFGVILGTGTGGGIVIDRRVLDGVNGIAGEWGHNPLPWPRSDELPGPACHCGRFGCIETYLSGTGFEADHARQTGQSLSAAQLAERAAQGDPACLASLERYHDRLARGLASIINVLDPDVIVLGGGVSNLPTLVGSVTSIWNRYIFSDTVSTALVRAEHGDSSGVRGAAWLWPVAGPS
jgi:fructokinase